MAPRPITLTGIGPNTGTYALEAEITCAGTPACTNNPDMNPQAKTTVITMGRVPLNCSQIQQPNKALLGPSDNANAADGGYAVSTLGLALGASTGTLTISLLDGTAPRRPLGTDGRDVGTSRTTSRFRRLVPRTTTSLHSALPMR